MSYGIWRKRGKGWSSIEIDTPGNGDTLRELRYGGPDSSLSRYRAVLSRLDKFLGGLYCDDEDLAALKWQAGQRERNPHMWIASYSPGGGEHVRWVAFDGPKALFDGALADEESGFYHWRIEHSPQGILRGFGWEPPKTREDLGGSFREYRQERLDAWSKWNVIVED